ncbi:U3 small nucleolar RNA-associated protein 14 homolog A isoform X2 [Hyperolius riggenbachi]|uniref:U3 small nucleolar RNA-associated protein 14 homolog A isoform X2 n=1 Tax=Hyperolius riggenbachi TaxID=752182 RepID=UPI0035A330CD
MRAPVRPAAGTAQDRVLAEVLAEGGSDAVRLLCPTCGEDMSPARSGDGPAAENAMEEELYTAEYAVSASEDEEESDSERKHQKLLEAISALDGKKRRKLAERTEASLQVSEFGISSEGSGEKISLSDLIEPIKKTTGLSTVKKHLNKLKDTKSVALPLNKEETQKIQRVISYQNASEEVAKWDQIVRENRRAERLVFPLADEPLKTNRIEDKVSGWMPRTPLEMEVFNILNKNKQPITDPLLTPVEEASLKAMSLEEAKLRRAELQKARALQSYYEAKARRERKIKSKKYHKVLKKSKKKDAVKEFDELRKTNPEAALEELQKLERARMEERMTLKHQNSGKWAKSKAIMAKYDEEARKAMQEQLQQNKDLTRKVEIVSESEESEAEETVPDFVNDAQVLSEGPNPWMSGKLSRDTKDSGSQEEEEHREAELGSKTEEPEEEEEEEEEESEDEVLLKEFEDKRRLRKEMGEQEMSAEKPSDTQDLAEGVQQEAEDKQVAQFNHLFQKLIEQNRKEEKRSKQSTAAEAEEIPEEEEAELETAEGGPPLVESLDRMQSLEALDALGQDEAVEELGGKSEVPPKRKAVSQTAKPGGGKQAKKSKLIDHNDVLPAKARKVRMPLLPTTVEEEEEEEQVESDDRAQKMIIQEAFAGDDVIDDFLKEKKAAEEAGKPKDVNLVLPGWGEWGGTDLKPSKRKRKKFIIKAPPAAPRKDQRLPNVIINEKRNIMASAHQVKELPFPFNSRTHFESSIRAPVGHTWNTERAVQKLTAPRVITKTGHIIEPITHDVFQQHAKVRKPEMELSQSKSSQDRKEAKGRQGRKEAKGRQGRKEAKGRQGREDSGKRRRKL